MHLPLSVQNNNVLDLGKQLAAAILNRELYTQNGCLIPNEAALNQNILDANGKIGDRRIPNGVCACCDTDAGCDGLGTSCSVQNGCKLLDNNDVKDLIPALKAWNELSSCG